jgi:DNA-binding response OmpR family regulator
VIDSRPWRRPTRRSPRTIEAPAATRDLPDVVLLAAEWQPRALIRAQLIEEGFEVVATDTWPAMRRHLRPGSKPQLAILDLKGLEHPNEVLRDVRVLMEPARVLVLSALGTVMPPEIRSLGFRVLSRPLVIGEVVAIAAAAVRRHTSGADE